MRTPDGGRHGEGAGTHKTYVARESISLDSDGEPRIRMKREDQRLNPAYNKYC